MRTSDLRGTPTVLNFCASWCGPSGEELPAPGSLRRELARMGVPIIVMNDDRDIVAARRFIHDVARGLPTAYGRGELQNAFRYLGLPWTILVSSHGQVVARWSGERTRIDLTAIRRAAAIELRRMTDKDEHGGHAGRNGDLASSLEGTS